MKPFCFIGFLFILMQSCKKESALINDTGVVYNYTSIKLDSGIQIGEIYHTSNFAAFTDIAYYNGLWYTVFRIGTAHAEGENGQIKVLSSTDGLIWKVINNIAISKIDLRDPKLTIDSVNNNLYVSFFGRNVLKNGNVDIQNYIVEFNKITNNFNSITQVQYNKINGNQFVFWRYTYHEGKMYCAAYRIPLSKNSSDNVYLFISDNTFYAYKPLEELVLGGIASETTVRFSEDGDIYLVARTETIDSPIGISLPDYNITNWTFNRLLSVLASPDFLFYKNKLLITGRDSKDRKFKFFSYNLNSQTVEKVYTFPSGHETGYAGMSFNPNNNDELWISYYTIDDNSSSINLAKINLTKFL